MNKKQDRYHNFSNVETWKNFRTLEEFPEGSYGEDIPWNKDSSWNPGQRDYTPFNYEFKTMHQDIPRKYPNAHIPHDNPNTEEQPPYRKGPNG